MTSLRDSADELVMSVWHDGGLDQQTSVNLRTEGLELAIWHCDDSGREERLGSVPKSDGIAGMVAWLLRSENLDGLVTVPQAVELHGTLAPVGGVFAYALSTQREDREIATLLARLDEETLFRLGAITVGLLGADLRGVLQEIVRRLARRDFAVADLEWNIVPPVETVPALRRALRACLVDAFVEYRQARRTLRQLAVARESQLAPFVGGIEELVGRWRRAQGRTMYYPPRGLVSLRRFLEEYALRHRELPRGVHSIPMVEMTHGAVPAGESTVDFDRLHSP